MTTKALFIGRVKRIGLVAHDPDVKARLRIAEYTGCLQQGNGRLLDFLDPDGEAL